MRRIGTLVLAAALLAGGCDLDVPDLNNPGLDQLQDNPTRTNVGAACTGLIIGYRLGKAASNGYVVQTGILGREAYNFDSADPRFVGELLAGPLQPGSPFGGAFWGGPYANLRNANIILAAAPQVAEFSAEEQKSITGFVKTMSALELLTVIVTRDTIGGIVMTDVPADTIPPLADRDAVYAEIGDLLDSGADDLAAAGTAFPQEFLLPPGFASASDPAGFLTFNRAIRARVAAYTGDYDVVLDALGESFLTVPGDDGFDLNAGVYLDYGTASGDTVNAMTNPNIYAHPKLATDAQMKGDGDPDDRFTDKVFQVETPGTAAGLTSDLKFNLYPRPDSQVPIIRNEELILLRAEANWQLDNMQEAADDINAVRTSSGGLDARADLDTNNFLDELLYNRRYSLMEEGGHRWIDLRRFDLLTDDLKDLPEHVINVRFPIPQNECNARPDEPKCALGSELGE